MSNWRAIVVDDCSQTAGAQQLVASLADPRITYTRNERTLGIAGNWNHCIEMSSTGLITLLHEDDELLPDYGHIMVEAHGAWPHAAAVFCRAEIIDEQGKSIVYLRDSVKHWLLPQAKKTFVLSGESGMRSLLRGNFIICPSLCYKRTLFEQLSFSSQWRFVLDVDMYFRALLSGAAFVGLPQVAFRYRRHSEQQTAVLERTLQSFKEQVELWRSTSLQARKRGWHSAAATADNMTIVKLQIGYNAVLDVLSLRGKESLKKLGLLYDTVRSVGQT
jgi:glycosyltransferase involved in cell wall biosynthesis